MNGVMNTAERPEPALREKVQTLANLVDEATAIAITVEARLFEEAASVPVVPDCIVAGQISTSSLPSVLTSLDRAGSNAGKLIGILRKINDRL